jgi:O-methyltransferase
MRIISGLGWIYKKFFSKTESEYASYILAERMSSLIYPGSYFSEFGKYWQQDKEFRNFYERFDGKRNLHSMDRKFFVKSLLKLTDGLEGNMAECGVYQGTTSWLMCDHYRNSNKLFYGFDSFEGVSQPKAFDKTYWKKGDLATSEEIAKRNLADFPFAKLYKGWIPEVFKNVQDSKYCFVHIDVDLYEPTRDSVEYFYSKLVPGGLMICDDYGFLSCPGARKAFDDFFIGKPEQVIEAPTGQGFIVKK